MKKVILLSVLFWAICGLAHAEPAPYIMAGTKKVTHIMDANQVQKALGVKPDKAWDGSYSYNLGNTSFSITFDKWGIDDYAVILNPKSTTYAVVNGIKVSNADTAKTLMGKFKGGCLVRNQVGAIFHQYQTGPEGTMYVESFITDNKVFMIKITHEPSGGQAIACS